MLCRFRPKHWTNPFLRSRTRRGNHFSSSVTASNVAEHHINTIAQTNSTDWVSQNNLFKKYPRLCSLEEECKSLSRLKQVLSYIFVSGLHRNPFIMSRVLYFCVVDLEEDEEEEACDLKRSYGALVFSQIDKPNTFSWNTMIRAFSVSNNSCVTVIAFQYYIEMCRRGTLRDKYTFPFLLQACGSISDLVLGEQVHCHAVVSGFLLDIFVQNALLNVYLVCDSVAQAWQLFGEMAERDVVSWTTMISGLVAQGFYIESLLVFNGMMVRELIVRPNVATMISVVSACANLGSLDHTKFLHAYLEKAGWGEVDVSVRNSLLDAYAKCGSIGCATQVFHEMHGLQRDMYSWTAMISGLAIHGHGRNAITLFLQMKRVVGIVPDAITFIAVLSACAHAGLVDEGVQIFESMEAEFGVVPELKHYGCMVDLFGRAELLQNAYEFVDRLPIEPNLAILGSLLSACRVHNNVELAEAVLKKIELSCECGGGAHVLLSNMYANENRWCEVVDVRKGMRGREEHRKGKSPGRSWIQVKGMVHEFVIGDKLHPQTMELYMVLDGLSKLLLL